MKLTENMRYPHPVLSEYSSDYTTGEFRCNFTHQMTTEGELKLSAELALDSKDLQSLVKSQRAATGYFVVCRRTYFNFLQTVPLGKSEKFFDASELFGTVTIRPAVWTLTRVDNFVSSLVHEEFGGAVTLAKGSVIALGPEFKFSVDKKRFKPFESIFELAEDARVEPGTVSVDPLRERITILAEPKTYKDLAGMRDMTAGKSILLNAVYMPAIMDVLALLQSGETSLMGKSWFRVFKAKCDELGIDPSTQKLSPLTVAQTLLKAPLKKTITVMGSI